MHSSSLTKKATSEKTMESVSLSLGRSSNVIDFVDEARSFKMLQILYKVSLCSYLVSVISTTKAKNNTCKQGVQASIYVLHEESFKSRRNTQLHI